MIEWISFPKGINPVAGLKSACGRFKIYQSRFDLLFIVPKVTLLDFEKDGRPAWPLYTSHSTIEEAKIVAGGRIL
tara:strand:+ start:78 stop:302 length:225 start_codon:yes stop_codon:yes gene_type:complete